MSNLLCLKEIEIPHLYHSELKYTSTNSNVYCVLAENCFIIFKKPSHNISLYRIPLNKSTKVKFNVNNFAIIYSEFEFEFSHSYANIVELWKKHLHEAIERDNRELTMDFYAEVVHIYVIQKMECPIVIGKTGCRLFIYYNYNYQRSDICAHVINFKYYNVEVLQQTSKNPRSSKTLTIKNPSFEFKLVFNESETALKWNTILNGAFERFIESSVEGIVLKELYRNDSNKLCADCQLPDPKWVSINLCVTLCDHCVAFHRQLGTDISRTQSAIIDEKCWKDSFLVILFNEIGNKVANEFWCKNIPQGKTVIVERKYKYKDYMDALYKNLNVDERYSLLEESVTTNDVTKTMKLWFSGGTDLNKDMVDSLMTIAEKSHQNLQRKFLSLQTNYSQTLQTEERDSLHLFEGVFNISYNNKKGMIDLCVVVLYRDHITIHKKTSTPPMNICSIDLVNITCAVLTGSNSLYIAMSPFSNIITSTGPKKGPSHLIIPNITIYDLPEMSLKIMKNLLYESLLPNSFESPIEETSMFFYGDIQFNGSQARKYKFHVTKTELLIGSPENIKFDLTMTRNMTITADGQSIVINISNDKLCLETKKNTQVIFDCLTKASKVRLVMLEEAKFVPLTHFIKSSGLLTEKIFEVEGNVDKVENLYQKLVTGSDKGVIKTNEYSTNDVASCLKKSLAYLSEPLIPPSVFVKLKYAAYTDNEEGNDALYKAALQLLPSVCHEILFHLLEMLFFVNGMSNYNQMNHIKLANSLARYVLSPFDEDSHDSRAILQYLIENFVSLFDYSAENQIAMLTLFNLITRIPEVSVRRSFAIQSSLVPLAKCQNLNDGEHLKLKFIDKVTNFISVPIILNNFTLIRDLVGYLFEGDTGRSLGLWHFIYLKDKVYRRQLHLGDNVRKTIIDRHKLPSVWLSGKPLDVYVFLSGEDGVVTRWSSDMFECQVKVSGERRSLADVFQPWQTLIVSTANSFKIYKENNDSSPLIDLVLSEISVYRGYSASSTTLYVLYGDNKSLVCEFKNSEEYLKFLSYYDRLHI